MYWWAVIKLATSTNRQFSRPWDQTLTHLYHKIILLSRIFIYSYYQLIYIIAIQRNLLYLNKVQLKKRSFITSERLLGTVFVFMFSTNVKTKRQRLLKRTPVFPRLQKTTININKATALGQIRGIIKVIKCIVCS